MSANNEENQNSNMNNNNGEEELLKILDGETMNNNNNENNNGENSKEINDSNNNNSNELKQSGDSSVNAANSKSELKNNNKDNDSNAGGYGENLRPNYSSNNAISRNVNSRSNSHSEEKEDINNKYKYNYNKDNFYYQHGVKNPETKEELRKNSLLDIFYFYTKQHSFIGHTPTFQEILKNQEHLDLSEFGRFCVEFKILVKPKKIAEIFKKVVLTNKAKELNYDLFVQTLQKLSVCANEEKKLYLMERIKIYKMKLKEAKEKNKKDGKEEKESSKNKEKEENLSGIKSEGEAEDDEKCQQEKNLENKNQEENKNNNDKHSNNSDKKSDNANIQNENQENLNEEGNNQNENSSSLNKKKNKKKDNISTNLKYFREHISKKNAKNSKSKKLKLIKPKTNSFLMMETKEELEEKISQLQQDYEKLNQKTNAQLEEEFYQYLEIDDINSYRKKMVGYIYPFQNRERESRFPLKSVMHPVQRDPKMQREMHKILVQRHEEMKKEKELKQMREKDLLFEKRKKKFEIETKKIREKMSQKNDYLQIKRNKEDYQKEKMNKLTWQQIQNSDYDNFIINDKDKSKITNLDDIFMSKSNQFEGDDADYLKNYRIKKGLYENEENNKSIGSNNRLNINTNNINNNAGNNKGNRYENINKTEPALPKFDTNLSRISSGNNIVNSSEYDIVNSLESNEKSK